MPRSRRQLISHHQPESYGLFIKKLVILGCISVIAALSIYVARDDHASFGLFHREALAQEIPTIINFRPAVLTSEPFLEADLYPQQKPVSQVEAHFTDLTVPPPVEDFVALNTRTGGEVALFWNRPEVVQAVDIYRTEIDITQQSTAQKIAEGVTEASYIDSDVQNRKRYQYRAVAVNTVNDKRYTSEDSPTALITPTDEVPPSPPTAVTVTMTETGNGLLVRWTSPMEDDFDHLLIYRSDVFGDRGSQVARILKASPEEYLDETVEPNTTYYYTVVAVDTSGNTSSDDFQLPAAGNEQPFTPIEQPFQAGQEPTEQPTEETSSQT